MASWPCSIHDRGRRHVFWLVWVKHRGLLGWWCLLDGMSAGPQGKPPPEIKHYRNQATIFGKWPILQTRKEQNKDDSLRNRQGGRHPDSPFWLRSWAPELCSSWGGGAPRLLAYSFNSFFFLCNAIGLMLKFGQSWGCTAPSRPLPPGSNAWLRSCLITGTYALR